MPITKTLAYKVGDKTYTTFEEAQAAEIAAIYNGAIVKRSTGGIDSTSSMSSEILEHAAELVDILTSKPAEEKPVRKPRSDKGKKRAASEAAINRALQDGKQ